MHGRTEMVLNDMRMMDLLGIDVGFSLTQKSTGIALIHDSELIVYRAGSTWEDRKRMLPPHFYPNRIAIDGPLLPLNADDYTVRECEKLFSRGLFSRRCKPGLSHFGTGFKLRQAAKDTVSQLYSHYGDGCYSLGHNLAEAFPNLFLGVLVSEDQYRAMPKLQRGHKFDWLYECAIKKLPDLIQYCVVPDAVYDRVRSEADHEHRAALICLLTAALANSDQATLAGSKEGGWFWLPPMDIWEPWAVEAVGRNMAEMAEGSGHHPHPR